MTAVSEMYAGMTMKRDICIKGTSVVDESRKAFQMVSTDKRW